MQTFCVFPIKIRQQSKRHDFLFLRNMQKAWWWRYLCDNSTIIEVLWDVIDTSIFVFCFCFFFFFFFEWKYLLFLRTIMNLLSIFTQLVGFQLQYILSTYSFKNMLSLQFKLTPFPAPPHAKAWRSINSSKWYSGVLSAAINIGTADYYINDKILDITIISQYF